MLFYWCDVVVKDSISSITTDEMSRFRDDYCSMVNVNFRTCIPVFIEIGLYLTDAEQKYVGTFWDSMYDPVDLGKDHNCIIV